MPTTPMDFRLWLCITLDAVHMLHPWKWLFWSLPVLRALWLSRNAQCFLDRAWSLEEVKSYCIAQWLSAALLLAPHYSVEAFLPLIQVHLPTHTPHWRGPQ